MGCSRDARGVLGGGAGAAGAARAAECRLKRRARRGRPAFERRALGVPGCHTKLTGLSRGCPRVDPGRLLHEAPNDSGFDMKHVIHKKCISLSENHEFGPSRRICGDVREEI